MTTADIITAIREHPMDRHLALALLEELAEFAATTGHLDDGEVAGVTHYCGDLPEQLLDTAACATTEGEWFPDDCPGHPLSAFDAINLLRWDGAETHEALQAAEEDARRRQEPPPEVLIAGDGATPTLVEE